MKKRETFVVRNIKIVLVGGPGISGSVSLSQFFFSHRSDEKNERFWGFVVAVYNKKLYFSAFFVKT